MAGTMPRSKPASHPEEVTDMPAETGPEKQPQVIPANFSRIESSGVLTNPKEGALGIDMWQGSTRPFVLSLLPEMPVSPGYRTIHDLVRRALLTKADTALLKDGDDIEPGHDLLTLRIEKLTDIGDFAQAVALYTQNNETPYHERLARAGVLARLYDGETALACLETKSTGTNFKDVPFWQQMTGICDYLLSKLDGEKKTAKLNIVPDSKILQQFLASKNSTYTLSSAQDLNSLSLFEVAVLAADHRLTYDGLNNTDLHGIAPPMLSLLLHDSAMPRGIKFRMMVAAVDQGLRSAADLKAFYEEAFNAKTKDGKIPAYETVDGWQRLAWLSHFAYTDKNRPVKAEEVFQKALPLEKEYGVAALFPFAMPLAKNIDAVSFDGESLKTGLKLMVLNQIEVPEDWVKALPQGVPDNKNDVLLRLAVALNSGNKWENVLPPFEDVDNLIEGLPEAQSQIIKMLYKKLDRSEKLHNSTDSGAYEKLPDLTFGDGYVMPSVGLMDSLDKALTGKRLGEVILLSSIALHGAAPDKIYAGLLREVVNGFETVGLTKEARELSNEVVLGLGK